MAAMRLRGTTVLAAATVMASLGLVSACGPGDAPGSHREAGQSSSQEVARGTWVDQPVSFEIGGVTVYATYRRLVRPASPGPAVLLIAGSGPTDRNGNTPLLPGPVNTLQAVADWLSADGVASLRYDKLGSGRTGLGPYTSRPGTIGIGPFEQEAAAALRFLARQPGVDRDRLGVIGHSEGALFALLLAAGASGPTPPIHALGLLEPLGVRYLDAIGYQVGSQIAASQRTGQISPEQASTAKHALATAITDLRATGTVPPGLPPVLSAVFSPVTALFLSQADRYDPAQLAARLPPGLPVLVTCSNADVQVTCGEVRHLQSGLARAPAEVDFVPLTGADHVLRQDPAGTAANDAQSLPFSPQLQQALRGFIQQHV
jgi:pimeloyl-ACP methyl ester carboxylesterase